MTKKKSTINQTHVVVASIIGLSILGYALVNRQTKLDIIKEQNKIKTDSALKQEEQEAEKEASRKRSLQSCLFRAEDDYWDSWSINCENSGTYIVRDGDGEIESCNLPTYLADSLKAEKQKEKDRCAELYGD